MAKYFLFLLCFILLVGCDEERDPRLGAWKQLNNLPFEGRGYGLSFSLFGKGYFLSGQTDQKFKDVWSYDPEVDSWTRKNDHPDSVNMACVAATRDKAYFLDYGARLYEYSPVTDSWKYLSTFPAGARTGLTGFALGGNVYFGTGYHLTPGEGYFNDFWKYDVMQNGWTRIGNLPAARRSNAFSFVIGDNAYVGLGYAYEAPPIYPDFYSYSEEKQQWKQIAEFPKTNLLIGNSFSSESKAYVGLAEWNHGEMYEYDPVANSWRRLAQFPGEYFMSTDAFTINNRIFVFGGWSGRNGTYGQQMWEFLP